MPEASQLKNQIPVLGLELFDQLRDRGLTDAVKGLHDHRHIEVWPPFRPRETSSRVFRAGTAAFASGPIRPRGLHGSFSENLGFPVVKVRLLRVKDANKLRDGIAQRRADLPEGLCSDHASLRPDRS